MLHRPVRESCAHRPVCQSDAWKRPWTAEHLAWAFYQVQASERLAWVWRRVLAHLAWAHLAWVRLVLVCYLVQALVLLGSAWRPDVKSAVQEKASIAAAQSIDLAHVDSFI